VSSTDSDLELLVDWEVSDPDGDLKTVSVLISDGDSTLEWHDIPASGSTAHGSQALVGGGGRRENVQNHRSGHQRGRKPGFCERTTILTEYTNDDTIQHTGKRYS